LCYIAIRTADDQWPVEKCLQLLTEQLQSYYSADGDRPFKSWQDAIPLPPALLLQIIVRGSGELPKFAPLELPKSQEVVDRLQKLDAGLKGATDPKVFLEQLESNVFSGLYDEAPYQAIKLAVRETDVLLPRQPLHGVDRVGQVAARARNAPGLGYILTPEDILEFVAEPREEDLATDRTVVDPLLLIAALSTLTGQSEGQDLRIRYLLSPVLTMDSQPSCLQHRVSPQLKSLITGETKSTADAKRLLREMAAKSKSQELIDALREIDESIEPRAVKDAKQ
jgi:hypothetical protein